MAFAIWLSQYGFTFIDRTHLWSPPADGFSVHRKRRRGSDVAVGHDGRRWPQMSEAYSVVYSVV